MHPRTSSLIFIGSIAVFIAAWFPPSNFLDFTADDMNKAFISWSLATGAVGIYLRTFTND